MNKSNTQGSTPSELISARIEELNDWRGSVLAQVRQIILKANLDITEEWKWNIPVWSKSGIICTGETYKKSVKLTFPKGASLQAPDGLFNSSLEGNARRAIDFFESSEIDEQALTDVVRAAIRFNSE